MASLIARKDEYDIATGNDADSDRHGIVTPDAGLMNPNHYLAVAIQYLYGGARPGLAGRRRRSARPWCRSSMIDRVAADLGAPARRGAGGLQVVRARAARRLLRLRRRGVRRARRSCGGRFGLDDRQGRHPARAARLGDPRRDGQSPSQHYADLTARPRRPGIRADRRRGQPRAEGQARGALPRATSPRTPLQERRSRPS